MTIIFYDISNKRDARWSPNTMKTELALIHKGLDFDLKYYSYPDIAPLLKSRGIKPADGPPVVQYTLPAIEDGGKTIMDSWNIAEYLDQKYPEKPLITNKSLDKDVSDNLIGSHADNLFLLIAPYVPGLLDERGAEYWQRTREQGLGPLKNFLDESKREELWKKAEAPTKQWGEKLKAKGGPFFNGKEISYADIVMISWLYFVKICDEETYQRYVKMEPALGTLYEHGQYLLK